MFMSRFYPNRMPQAFFFCSGYNVTLMRTNLPLIKENTLKHTQPTFLLIMQIYCASKINYTFRCFSALFLKNVQPKSFTIQLRWHQESRSKIEQTKTHSSQTSPAQYIAKNEREKVNWIELTTSLTPTWSSSPGGFEIQTNYIFQTHNFLFSLT